MEATVERPARVPESVWESLGSDRMVGTPLRCDSRSFARTLDNLEDEKSTLRSEP